MRTFLLLIIASLLYPCTSYTQWQTYTPPVNCNYTNVSVASANVIWAFGSNPGTVVRTTNGGTNWIISDYGLDDTIRLFLGDALDANTAWVAGGANWQRVFKTTNGGANWTELNYPRREFINKIRFFNANTGMMLVDHVIPPTPDTCNYLVSRDGGNNWYRPPHAPVINLIDDVYILDSNLIVFLATPINPSRPRLYRLQGGLDGAWTSYDPPDTNLDFAVFKDQNNGFGTNGYVSPIFRTTNGGMNWFSTPANALTTSNGIWVPGTNWIIAYGCCYQYLSKDFGNTYYSLHSNDFTRGDAFDTNSIWMAGWGGNLYKLIPALIGIRSVSNEVPNDFALHQNFPNPFNPDTKIRFEIPKSSNIELVVYDVSGREVYRLSEQNKQPGKYEVSFDASTYASGVYFYKLVAGDFTKTMKMVLLK